MYVFSPLPRQTKTSDDSTRLILNPNAHLKFKFAEDSRDAEVGLANPKDEMQGQVFSRVVLNNHKGWARLVFNIEDIDSLLIGRAPEQELELSFSVFCDPGENLTFDLIGILQSSGQKENYEKVAVFYKNAEISFGPLREHPYVLQTRVRRTDLPLGANFILAFQVARGGSAFYMSPVILTPARSSDQTDLTVSEGSVTIPPEDIHELPVVAAGATPTIVRDVEVQTADMYRSLSLIMQPNEKCSVSIDLDDLGVIPAERPIEIDAVIQSKYATGRAVGRIERGGLFGVNFPGLNHDFSEIGVSSVPRCFRASVPRDDGLSGRRLVFSFKAHCMPLECELTVRIREGVEGLSFGAVKSPSRVVAPGTVSGGGPVPKLFDSTAALRSIGEGARVEKAEDNADWDEETLWTLFGKMSPGEMDPHPLFSTAWHYRLLAQADLPTPSNPAEAFEAYLASDIVVDPHPLIDEAYLREQLGAERGALCGLEGFLASTSIDLRPNRLFDARRVAAAMAAMGASMEGASAAAVLQRYLEEPRFWSISTSPLFDPATIPDGDAAPLIRYLGDSSLWSLSPTPLFDAAHYSRQAGVPRTRKVAPLAEYLMLERQIFPDPGPLFNARYYAMQSEETWSGGASPLETYVRTLIGRPHPRYDRKSYLAKSPGQKIVSVTLDDVLKAGTAFDGPRHMLRTSLDRVVVQMTGPRPRNPYYRQIPDAFVAAKCDFRFSTSPDDMADYATKRKDLMFWWHQLEPFYHDPVSVEATKDRAKRLVDTLTRMKANGALLIHTWHNALPYSGRYRDIDYELLLDVAPLFDLILVHAALGVPWIRKFAPSASVAVVPHPSLVRHFNTTIDRNVARDILKIPRDAFVVHSFGEMKAYKRVDLLVAAWSHLKQTRHPRDAVLVLTGHWKEKSAIYEAAHGLPDCVIVDQIMSDGQLALWIAAADVCAFSHPQVWASGAVMSALSFGKPMIVPDETGLTEVVEDDQNGFVFKNGDPESLADAIRRAREFPYPQHAAFLNHERAAELHPFRLQPQISQLLENL